ncbi:MAG: heavy-metal-associated domain-containing protein [Bacteroidota bacterium]
MKKTNTYLSALLILVTVMTLSAQAFAQEKKIESIQIKTSAMCKQCKERIENGLVYDKGVKDVVLDVDTKIVTIRYNTKATNPETLRKKISKLGYDADTIPCDKAAYEKLPACCKKDAPKH